MKAKQNSFSISLIILLVWAAFVVIGNWFITRGSGSLEDLVRDRVNFVFFIASFLLLGVVTYFKWRRPVGLKAADPFCSWLLLWLPALYILGYLGFAYRLGLPSTLVISLVFVNSLRVGVEEELMFRGILFHGLLSRFNIWPAIWLSTLLYGSAHLLNGFLTGNFSAALFQSLQAFMIGLMLVAIRLRTKSLYPAIAIHGLWNFAIFTRSVATGLVQGSAPAGADPSFIQQIVVVVLVPLSLLLYGLWLLRGIGNKEKAKVLS